MTKDNVTNLFGSNDNTNPPEPAEKTLPVWNVSFKDGNHPDEDAIGDFRMSPISAAFYDFDDQVDSFYLLDGIRSITRVGTITRTELDAERTIDA